MQGIVEQDRGMVEGRVDVAKAEGIMLYKVPQSD